MKLWDLFFSTKQGRCLVWFLIAQNLFGFSFLLFYFLIIFLRIFTIIPLELEILRFYWRAQVFSNWCYPFRTPRTNRSGWIALLLPRGKHSHSWRAFQEYLSRMRIYKFKFQIFFYWTFISVSQTFLSNFLLPFSV